MSFLIKSRSHRIRWIGTDATIARSMCVWGRERERERNEGRVGCKEVLLVWARWWQESNSETPSWNVAKPKTFQLGRNDMLRLTRNGQAQHKSPSNLAPSHPPHHPPHLAFYPIIFIKWLPLYLVITPRIHCKLKRQQWFISRPSSFHQEPHLLWLALSSILTELLILWLNSRFLVNHKQFIVYYSIRQAFRTKLAQHDSMVDHDCLFASWILDWWHYHPFPADIKKAAAVNQRFNVSLLTDLWNQTVSNTEVTCGFILSRINLRRKRKTAAKYCAIACQWCSSRFILLEWSLGRHQNEFYATNGDWSM